MVDKAYLKQIVDATNAGQPAYVGQVMGQPMLAHNPPLIEINGEVTNPADPSQVLCRSTAAANDYLTAHASDASEAHGSSVKSAGNYSILTNVTLPPAKKRGNTGGAGAPTKYPFADMPVGGVFFSANSEHNKGDAVKALGSTVSAQNDKYAEPTGEMKTVTRAVRDPVTKKAVIGADGKKVTETVQLPVKKYNRKFTIRPVQAGYKSGDWVAPEDGALVARTV